MKFHRGLATQIHALFLYRWHLRLNMCITYYFYSCIVHRSRVHSRRNPTRAYFSGTQRLLWYLSHFFIPLSLSHAFMIFQFKWILYSKIIVDMNFALWSLDMITMITCSPWLLCSNFTWYMIIIQGIRRKSSCRDMDQVNTSIHSIFENLMQVRVDPYFIFLCTLS